MTSWAYHLAETDYISPTPLAMMRERGAHDVRDMECHKH